MCSLSAGGSDQTEREQKEPAQEPDGGWKPVHQGIWTPSGEPSGGFHRLSRLIVRSVSSVPPLVIAVPALLLVPFTFVLAYDLGGSRLFGLALASIWTFLIVLTVIVLEKTGYSKNYESWDFPLRRVVFIPVGFLIALGLFYLILTLAGLYH